MDPTCIGFSDTSEELVHHVNVLKENRSRIAAEIRGFKTRISDSKTLENYITQTKRSEDFLSPAQIAGTQQEIAELLKVVETKRESLQKAEGLNRNIAHMSQCILTLEEKEEIKAQIFEAENDLKSLLEPLQLMSSSSAAQLASVLQVQENIRQDLECVVCIEMPLPSIQIFSCQENHLLCINCHNHPDISTCPICRQDFAWIPAQRNRLAEKMVEKLT